MSLLYVQFCIVCEERIKHSFVHWSEDNVQFLNPAVAVQRLMARDNLFIRFHRFIVRSVLYRLHVKEGLCESKTSVGALIRRRQTSFFNSALAI